MIYLELFWSFFQIGLFSFGGGYAALPLIEDQVVNIRAWLSLEAFSDLVTISQMTPGPIAINAASFVGIQVAGIPGAVLATFACVLPCTVIVLVLAKLYQKYSELPLIQSVLQGLRPAIVALIASAAWSIGQDALVFAGGKTNLGGLNLFAVAIFILSLFAYKKFKQIDPIVIMLIMGFLGGLGFYLFKL